MRPYIFLVLFLLISFKFNLYSQNKILITSSQNIKNIQLVNPVKENSGYIKKWENVENTYLVNCNEPATTFIKSNKSVKFKLYRFDTGESTGWIDSIEKYSIKKSFNVFVKQDKGGANITTKFPEYLQQWIEISQNLAKENGQLEILDLKEEDLEPRGFGAVNFSFITDKNNKFNKKEDILIKWETSNKVREISIVDTETNVKLWTAKDVPEKYINFDLIKNMQASELNLQTGRYYKLNILLNNPNTNGTTIYTTDFIIEPLVFITSNRQPFLITDSLKIEWNSSFNIKEIILINKKTKSTVWNTKNYKKSDIKYSDINSELKTQLLPHNTYELKILLESDKPDKSYILDFEILFDKVGYTQYLNFIND